MDIQYVEQLSQFILNRLDVGWTFLLLATRYIVFLMLVPGLGGGIPGISVRYPAAIALSVVTLNVEQTALIPSNVFGLLGQLSAEILLGSVVALVPMLIVAGAQTAGHLATGTMGLNGAQLFDPSTQTQMSDLSRIYSDLTILIFLLLGGHYIAIAKLAEINISIAPGSFVLSSVGLETLVDQSARIFQIGCLISAPVIVALLLTNFVMGIISKAIPTVNIFIISFPMTIGVGLMMSIVALPEVARLLEREFQRLPELLGRVLQ
jgi:flagellar biosynthetic protein FliR